MFAVCWGWNANSCFGERKPCSGGKTIATTMKTNCKAPKLYKIGSCDSVPLHCKNRHSASLIFTSLRNLWAPGLWIMPKSLTLESMPSLCSGFYTVTPPRPKLSWHIRTSICPRLQNPFIKQQPLQVDLLLTHLRAPHPKSHRCGNHPYSHPRSNPFCTPINPYIVALKKNQRTL